MPWLKNSITLFPMLLDFRSRKLLGLNWIEPFISNLRFDILFHLKIAMLYAWKHFLFIALSSLELGIITWKPISGSANNKKSGGMSNFFFTRLSYLARMTISIFLAVNDLALTTTNLHIHNIKLPTLKSEISKTLSQNGVKMPSPIFWKLEDLRISSEIDRVLVLVGHSFKRHFIRKERNVYACGGRTRHTYRHIGKNRTEEIQMRS